MIWKCLTAALAAVSITQAAAPILAADVLAARTVRDNFEGDSPSPERWFVCHRDENEFRIEEVAERSFRALRAAVHPAPKTPMVDKERHAFCRDEDGNYLMDGYERAELWEADHLRERFGKEMWYGFSMFIDPNIPADHDNRVVIGQWKQNVSYENDHSPIIAQRFKFRRFAITIEQDNLSPNSDPSEPSCRITVATDVAPAASAADSQIKPSVLNSDSEPNEIYVSSMAVDRFGKVHGAAKECQTDDTVVEKLNPLPNPFGQWTTMLYHIKGAANRTGLLEIWANGKPIARVRGRIGYGDSVPGLQYFKFGPYRDPAGYDTYALIAKFGRGPSRQDAE